jgi:hypothetical protein
MPMGSTRRAAAWRVALRSRVCIERRVVGHLALDRAEKQAREEQRQEEDGAGDEGHNDERDLTAGHVVLDLRLAARREGVRRVARIHRTQRVHYLRVYFVPCQKEHVRVVEPAAGGWDGGHRVVDLARVDGAVVLARPEVRERAELDHGLRGRRPRVRVQQRFQGRAHRRREVARAVPAAALERLHDLEPGDAERGAVGDVVVEGLVERADSQRVHRLLHAAPEDDREDGGHDEQDAHNEHYCCVDPEQAEDLLPGAAAAAEADDDDDGAGDDEDDREHVHVRPVGARRAHRLVARHELEELEHRRRVHAQPDAQRHARRAHQEDEEVDDEQEDLRERTRAHFLA